MIERKPQNPNHSLFNDFFSRKAEPEVDPNASNVNPLAAPEPAQEASASAVPSESAAQAVVVAAVVGDSGSGAGPMAGEMVPLEVMLRFCKNGLTNTALPINNS